MSYGAESSLVISTECKDALINLNDLLTITISGNGGFKNFKVFLILRLKIASILRSFIKMHCLKANSKLLVPLR